MLSVGLANLEPLGYKFVALWTVYERACFFVTLDGNVTVTMHHKFQQSVQMTVVVPRPQFIDRVGHCSYVTETGALCNCAEEREDSSVQFFGEVVGSPLLCNERCWGSDSAVLVEVPQVQFIDGRRYPCCGTEAVWRNCAKTVDFHRCRYWPFFQGELITQVMSSCQLVSSDCRCIRRRCGHTHVKRPH